MLNLVRVICFNLWHSSRLRRAVALTGLRPSRHRSRIIQRLQLVLQRSELPSVDGRLSWD